MAQREQQPQRQWWPADALQLTTNSSVRQQQPQHGGGGLAELLAAARQPAAPPAQPPEPPPPVSRVLQLPAQDAQPAAASGCDVGSKQQEGSNTAAVAATAPSPPAAAAAVAGGAGALTALAVGFSSSGREDEDDVPLVSLRSKRAAAAGVPTATSSPAPPANNLDVRAVAAAGSNTNSPQPIPSRAALGGVGLLSLLRPPGQPAAPSPGCVGAAVAATAAAASGSTPPPPVADAQEGDGSVAPPLAAAPACLPRLFAPIALPLLQQKAPQQQQQQPPTGGPRLLYAAVFLTAASREVLLGMVLPLHAHVRGDHMTLAHRPTLHELLALPLGADASVRVLGAASDARCQAVFVEGPAWLQPAASCQASHVTLSFADGSCAADAGGVVSTALQQLAGGTPPLDAPDTLEQQQQQQCQHGSTQQPSYQHFDEPLPLVGRVGVRVVVPPAVAARLRAAGLLALGPQPPDQQQEQQEQGRSDKEAGEVEVVLYSLEGVVSSGCCASLDAATLADYRSRHAAVLGLTDAPPLAISQPAISSVSTSTGLGPAGAGISSPHRLAATPPAAYTPLAHEAAAAARRSPFSAQEHGSPVPASAAAAAATGSTPAASPLPPPLLAVSASPPSAAGRVGGLLQLLSNAHAVAAASPAPAPLLPAAAGDGSPAPLALAPAAVAPSSPSSVSTLPPLPAPCDSPSGDSSGAVRGGSGGGDGAESDGSDELLVQFLSSVRPGDYVAVRPFAPTHGQHSSCVQGYVREFACEEPFQASGVLVVLADDTIGFVMAVLDPSCSNGGINLSALQPSSGSGAAKAAAKAAAEAAAVAYPVDRATLPGTSSGGLDAADASVLRCSWDDLIGTTSTAAAATTAAAADGAGEGWRRNARDAERDLALWREFDALQHQHGEALCASILASCNQDFAEAIRLISAQASQLEEAAAAAAAAAARQAAGIAAATATAEAFASRQASLAAAAAAGEDAEQPGAFVMSDSAAAPPAAAADEEFLQQLALSLDLSPSAAVQLARLVPHASASDVVQQLQEQRGDVNKAADALIATTEAVAAAAAAEAAEAAAGPSSSTSAGGAAASSAQQQRTPEARVAASFMAAKDAGRVGAAARLCELCPGLQQEMAELILQEHGDSVHEAAKAVADMQARELQARTAGDAGAGPSSSTSGGTRQMSSSGAAAAAGSGPSSGQAAQSVQLLQDGSLTKADQRAIIAAIAELDAKQQQLQQRGIPPTPTPQDAPGQQQQQQLRAHHQQQQQQQPQQQRAPAFRPPPQRSPPPPPQRYHHAAAAAAADHALEQDAKQAAKVAAEELYAKSRTLGDAANVHVTVAQQLLQEGDSVGARAHLAEAERRRAESRAAFDEAQRMSWHANNRHSNCWEMDLHGLGPAKALDKFVQHLRVLQSMEHPGGVLFRVIVGQGHHSEGNVPKLKLNVLQYLEEERDRVAGEGGGRPWAVTWEVDPGNPGVINVHIPQQPSE